MNVFDGGKDLTLYLERFFPFKIVFLDGTYIFANSK